MNLSSTTLSALLAMSLCGTQTIAGASSETTSGLDTLSSQDRASLQAAYLAASLIPSPTESGFAMRNRSQGIDAKLNGDDFSVTPTQGDWTWGLALQSFGFEGSHESVETATTFDADGRQVVYHWTPALDEWFINGTRGIEHGYTLRTRPANLSGAERLTFHMDVLGALKPSINQDAKGVRFLDDKGACNMTYSGLTVFDAEGTIMPARFVEHGDELILSIDERNAIYPLTIDPMVQLGYFKASNPEAHDLFGYSVAISGDTAVVGAPREDSAAVGVNGDESDNSELESGAAYVFVRQGASWSQQAYLKPSNTQPGMWFGSVVDIDGDTIVVSAPKEVGPGVGVNDPTIFLNPADRAGAVYVYTRTGTTWSQDAYVKATNTNAFDRFGDSVAIDGDWLIVGAPYERSIGTGLFADPLDNSAFGAGAAYLYTRTGSTWSPFTYLKASNTDAQDRFGASVAVSGHTVVIGAPSERSSVTGVNGNQADDSTQSAGAVYVFSLKGEIFSQDAYLKPSNTDFMDFFGLAVAIDGDTIAISSPGEDSGSALDPFDESTPSAGAGFIFTFDGANWSQQAYIKADFPMGGVNFGEHISSSGERVLFGATRNSSAAKGINGDQTDVSAPNAGAAFVFERSGSTWDQVAYIKSSNTESSDAFGAAISLDGDNVFIGAYAEDSAAVGMNGDQSDNASSGSGAAYYFDLDSDCGVTLYGPGTGANIGTLTSYSAPIPGGKFDIELSGIEPTGWGFMMIGVADAYIPILGGTILVDPTSLIMGPDTVIPAIVNPGGTVYPFTIPMDLAGATFYTQIGVVDPGMPGGLAFSNGLKIEICP